MRSAEPAAGGNSDRNPRHLAGPDTLRFGARCRLQLNIQMPLTRSAITDELFALRRPFEVELVEHMYPIARQLGYDLLLSPFLPGRTQDAAIDELLRYRCAGL